MGNYRYKAKRTFLILFVLITLCAPAQASGSAETREPDRDARNIIEKAKTWRDLQEYYIADVMLQRVIRLNTSAQTTAEAWLEMAYIEYLRGSGRNIYLRQLERAIQWNPDLELPGDYHPDFKELFYQVRQARTGVPPPPPPPLTAEDIPELKGSFRGSIPLETVEKEQMKKNRLDFQYIYEYLSPHDQYGAWESYYIKYYRYQEPTFNFFIHGGMVKREGKNDYIVLFGFAKDWNPRLFTYTVVAKGTVSTYLPNARFDHDFNFKVGKNANVLLTVGVTYIKYYVPAQDFIISAGLTWYTGNWVPAYRLFQNHKYPGNITSYSHLLSLEYGVDKDQISVLSVSWGSQAYLALYVTLPEQVRQDAFNINVLHRRWLTKGVGIFAQAGYLDLKDTYRKYLLTGGIFFEF